MQQLIGGVPGLVALVKFRVARQGYVGIVDEQRLVFQVHHPHQLEQAPALGHVEPLLVIVHRNQLLLDHRFAGVLALGNAKIGKAADREQSIFDLAPLHESAFALHPGEYAIFHQVGDCLAHRDATHTIEFTQFGLGGDLPVHRVHALLDGLEYPLANHRIEALGRIALQAGHGPSLLNNEHGGQYKGYRLRRQLFRGRRSVPGALALQGPRRAGCALLHGLFNAEATGCGI